MIKFYRGLYASYVLETHGQGIYFATDKKVIIMNGTEYIGPLADSTAVKSITLSDDGSKFVVEYLDGQSQDMEMATSEYASNIEDKTLTMPNAVGGIAKGTKVSDLEGKTYDEILDDLLFPTVNPTFTSPSATIKLSGYSATQEVGAAAPVESNFTTTFNKGSINLNGVKQNDRAGEITESYIYFGEDVSNTTLPQKVTLGESKYYYHVDYSEGPQPLDNKGNNYSTPLKSGSVNSSAITINGTYPWYASTGSATAENPVVKQSLVAWNTTVGAMSTGNFVLQPSGTLAQVFKLPRQLKTLQMLNTVSNVMETIGTTEYTESTEVININETEVTYYVYTYNGATRGSVTLLAKF